MIRSMTGYGRAQQMIDGRDVTVEIKSVNHRFFEWSVRTPRGYGYLDDKLKSFLQGSVSRGKIEISVQLVSQQTLGNQVSVNQELAESYIKTLRELGQTFSLTDDLSLTAMTRFSDLFTVRRTPEDEEELWRTVSGTAQQALDSFLQMRRTEGEKMRADLICKLRAIEDDVAEVVKLSPETVNAYRERLSAKLRELLQDAHVEEQRLVTEAAIFAEKVAVDEETVRLGSHLAQFSSIIDADEPVGRKLDFLVQEMNREVNTIGSKAMDLRVTKLVVNMKSEIEKIREQIQNIE